MGQVGFLGVIGIIVLGHNVTIPTAFAVAEIAANQRVQGMKYSTDADLTVIGFTSEALKNIEELSVGYQDLGNILFVSSNRAKAIN